MTRKALYLLLAILSWTACTKTAVTPAPAEEDMTFLTIQGASAKSQMGTNNILAWSSGDQIGLFSDAQATPEVFTLRSGSGYSVASFTGRKPEGKSFSAYYPASASCDGKTFKGLLNTRVQHAYPDEPVGTLPMFGRSIDFKQIEVKSLCGILQFNLKGSGLLKSVMLDAGKPISGPFTCNLQDNTFTIEGGSNIIMMDASKTELSFYKDTPFRFILPAGDYDDLRIVTTSREGVVTIFRAETTVQVENGTMVTPTFSATDVELIDMNFVMEKNTSGCFWYTSIAKNPSFCVSYLFGIGTKAEYDSYSGDTERWLNDHGQFFAFSANHMQVLDAETQYVAVAVGTSITGSLSLPIVKTFTTPALQLSEANKPTINVTNIQGNSVDYTLSLPEGVTYVSEVYVLAAEEFATKDAVELAKECLSTRRNDRALSGTISGLMPGVNYVLFCVGDDEVYPSKIASVAFSTGGTSTGGGTEDIDEQEIH